LTGSSGATDKTIIKGFIWAQADNVTLLGLSVNYNNPGNSFAGITVKSGYNSATVKVNGCRFLNGGSISGVYAVENQGTGTLDATGNYWGALGASGNYYGIVSVE